jgi:excisionase family DNA binding protein
MNYYMSPKETCRLLDIDLQTLRKMAREGRIDYVQPIFGGHRRYNVNSYMEGGAKRRPSPEEPRNV